MLKKMIIGGLVAILVGAVSVGVYDYLRSESTFAYQEAGGPATEHETLANGRGNWSRGSNGNGTAVTASDGCGAVSNGQGSANGQGSLNGQGTASGQGLTDGSQVPQPQAAVDEWVTVQGMVTAVELNALTVETTDGELLVQLGPEHFWTAQGITFEAGDQVEIIGFYEDGSFTAGTVKLVDTGETLALRDADGRPLWAGGPGRGNSSRAGQDI